MTKKPDLSTPEHLSGWLYKTQKILPTKKKRYFKLATQVLSSHVGNDADPSWEQNVHGAEVVGIEDSHRIIVMCQDRTVRLATDTADDYSHWLNALQKAADHRIENHYTLGETLHKGTFAKLFMGFNRSTLEKVAVKVIDMQNDNVPRKQSLLDELSIMKSVNHPNIVRTHDIFDTKNRFYIVLEYMPGGTLGDVLKKYGRFPEDQARRILADILHGIAYLHDRSIVHGEIKLKNILCDRSELPARFKLADFGLPNLVDNRVVSKVATKFQVRSPYFVAPEVLKEEQCGTSVDTWAVGIILYIMLTRRYPFAGKTMQETLELVVLGRFSLKGSEWDNVSGNAKRLLQALLRVNPQQRLSAKEALGHVWFAD